MGSSEKQWKCSSWTRKSGFSAAAQSGVREYPQAAGGRIQGTSAVLDGRPSFQALQSGPVHAGHRVVSYGFDVLHVGCEDLTGLAL